jgi:hypothetical protein
MCEVSWQRAGKDSQKRTKRESKSYALAEIAKTTTRDEYRNITKKEKSPGAGRPKKKKKKKRTC